ncbi:hypothetical protein K9U41_18920, partial [Xanthobacter autotrophicus]
MEVAAAARPEGTGRPARAACAAFTTGAAFGSCAARDRSGIGHGEGTAADACAAGSTRAAGATGSPHTAVAAPAAYAGAGGITHSGTDVNSYVAAHAALASDARGAPGAAFGSRAACERSAVRQIEERAGDADAPGAPGPAFTPVAART